MVPIRSRSPRLPRGICGASGVSRPAHARRAHGHCQLHMRKSPTATHRHRAVASDAFLSSRTHGRPRLFDAHGGRWVHLGGARSRPTRTLPVRSRGRRARMPPSARLRRVRPALPHGAATLHARRLSTSTGCPKVCERFRRARPLSTRGVVSARCPHHGECEKGVPQGHSMLHRVMNGLPEGECQTGACRRSDLRFAVSTVRHRPSGPTDRIENQSACGRARQSPMPTRWHASHDGPLPRH